MNAVEIYEKASWDLEHNKITLGEFEERIKPLYDVEPVRHGHWDIIEYEYFTCSECGYDFWNGCDCTAEAKEKLTNGVYPNYCPNCGAKMDGKEQEHE